MPDKVLGTSEADLVDKLGTRFTVITHYTRTRTGTSTNVDEIEISSYELEGDNISHEELIERFGLKQVEDKIEMIL